MAFFVAEFVLVMQFLWKYIDVIIGKGFSLGVLLELIFYFAVRIIPEAVPVSILIASVMVFGNLAEKYEISSLKSAGISLIRIMWMGVLISIFTAFFSLVASNYLKPRANYKFLYRFNSIRKQKPALNIAEGVFSKDFKNFVIRVGDKDPNGKDISDILIYDQSGVDRRLINVLAAEKGIMYSGQNDDYFVMELEQGEQYRELEKKKKPNEPDKKPFVRTKFKKWRKVFDMSQFDVEAQSFNVSRKEYDLLNASQLLSAIDSIDRKTVKNRNKLDFNYSKMLDLDQAEATSKTPSKNLPKQVKDAIKKQKAQETKKNKTLPKSKQSIRQLEDVDISGVESFIETFDKKQRYTLIKAAQFVAKKRQEKMLTTAAQEDTFNYSKSRYILRLHQQFSWAVICIVFLFIGAPLGSIVRKGGYGYPLLVAIIFFMLFIILNIMGDRLSKTLAISAQLAAWLPVLIITPMAVFLTHRAVNDYGLGDISGFFTRLFKRGD